MHSHHCQFTRGDLFKLLAVPLGPVMAFAAAMHLGALTGWLPAPRPALDMDRTILLHQAEASPSAHATQVLLLGDSSCLMDVSAPLLGELLQQSVLNLGTLSFVDLAVHARLLESAARASQGRLRSVVVLLHPEALRRPSASAYHVEVVDACLAGRDMAPAAGWRGQFEDLLGLHLFRGRILGRFLPSPLPLEYASTYGFTTDLWEYLSRHQGSAISPGKFAFAPRGGSPEYRLARQLEAGSRELRQRLPPGARLAVGITPTPASFVLPDHAETCVRMLRQWSNWLQADQSLTNLPAVLPDDWFASVTHLTPAGAERFTRLLAVQLGQSAKEAGLSREHRIAPEPAEPAGQP